MSSLKGNQHPVILMLGTSTETKGGISSVINVYIDSGLMETCNIKYIVTHEDGGRLLKLLVAVSAYIQFLWLLTIEPVDIVHIHSASRASFYRKSVFIVLAKIFGKKIVFHLHGGGFKSVFFDRAPPLLQRLIVRLLRFADVIIVLSAQWKSQMEDILGDDACIYIVHNSVIVPSNLQHKPIGNPPTVLYLGLVCKEKGLADLIMATASLKKRLTFRLKIAGNGDLDEYRELSARLGVGEWIEFLGWVGSAEKNRLLREADLVVLPSYNEGLPMSILEAFSYGIPVVATRVGGIPDAVSDGENGYLIEPGDHEALAEMMFRVLSDNQLHNEMCRSAIDAAHNKFGMASTKNALQDIYAMLRNGTLVNL